MADDVVPLVRHPLELKLEQLELGIKSDFLPTVAEKIADLRVRWSVGLTKKAKTFFTTTYTTGIGYLEGTLKYLVDRGNYSVDVAGAIRRACSVKPSEYGMRTLYAVPPKPAHVWYSCLLSAHSLQYPNYESWSRCMGLDVDSIKNKSEYDNCLVVGLHIRDALGEPEFSQLLELSSNY